MGGASPLVRETGARGADVTDPHSSPPPAGVRSDIENATPPITARSRAEFATFLEGLELVEPGIVSCARWRTDPGTTAPVVAQFGAVARKP
ncbi:SAM-dependent methyltransferase [Streptomyces sp. NPDC048411]|uniref:SAM-dependent methyltransferase n=1 Tax=Streptomyces sp. NPDC048411 TaxID=3157206 RepID=UPI003451A5C8